jgi:hypothetical protein
LGCRKGREEGGGRFDGGESVVDNKDGTILHVTSKRGEGEGRRREERKGRKEEKGREEGRRGRGGRKKRGGRRGKGRKEDGTNL